MAKHGREVWVHIDTPFATTPPRRRSSSPSPNRRPSLLALNLEIGERTPKRRNGSSSQTNSSMSTNEMNTFSVNKTNANQLKKSLQKNLSLPDLRHSSVSTISPSSAHRVDNTTTPHDKLPQVPSKESLASFGSNSDRGGVGILSDDSDLDASDDDGDDDDSLNTAEKFDRVIMKVAEKDGVVTLVYPTLEADLACESASEQGGDEHSGVSSSSNVIQSEEGRSTSTSSASDRGEKEQGIMVEHTDDSGPFELASTNIHTEEDKRQRERTKIRLSVLSVAVEAYKKNRIPVPDALLAQINENQTTGGLSGGGGGRKKRAAGSEEMNRANGGGSFWNPQMGKGEVNRTRSKMVKSKKARGPGCDRGFGDNASKECRHQQRRNIKRLRLNAADEIHASPCQCALSLVGMRGFCVHSPINGQNNISPVSFFRSSSGRDLFLDSSVRENQPALPSRKKPVMNYDQNLSGGPPTMGSGKPAQKVKFVNVNSEIASSKMVRTASASAGEQQCVSHLLPTASYSQGVSRVVLNAPDNDTQLQLGGPPESATLRSNRKERNQSVAMFPRASLHMSSSLQHPRADAATYAALGYHEITLIRGEKDTSHDEDGFVSWNAVTVRCADHDEFDVLCKALKTSARAKIVPFSPDPRAKLKKQARQRTASKLQKATRKSSRTRRKSTRSNVNGAAETMPSIQLNHLSPDSSPYEPLAQRQTPSISFKSPNMTTTKSSAKWNKNDHCELCGLYFTLLSRRHHCRKCDRSCCSDCSSVMLVRGGEQTRYCNPCSSDILYKQSRALHRNAPGHYRRFSSTTLPGKVHPACRHMGVGVLGKLPHWKNYLSFKPESRPAVGRISIELIQGLALPTVDMRGTADPYVRATITGYDRDMRWNLKEWLPENRYSLCGVYCSRTLSPVWRGKGRRGGELLTLPVISTAGAVLRLEVLDYDVMSNSRGRDKLLALVEIPLSDIPNANLRRAKHATSNKPRREEDTVRGTTKKKLVYDGYCDRWYRLQCASGMKKNSIVIAKPIDNPQIANKGSSERVQQGRASHNGNNAISKTRASDRTDTRRNKPLEEIGKRFHGLFATPLEWFGLELVRPGTICEKHRPQSALHVRIKLNASEVGDLLSHTWFPPVQPIPDLPPYDPQALLTAIIKVYKKLSPYLKRWKFVEDAIKWRHTPKTCIMSYLVLAFHIFFMRYFLFFLHIHVLTFLVFRLRKMLSKARESTINESESHRFGTQVDLRTMSATPLDAASSSDIDFIFDESNHDLSSLHNSKHTTGANPGKWPLSKNSPSLEALNESGLNQNQTTPSLSVSKDKGAAPATGKGKLGKKHESEAEIADGDTARLGKAVSWIAKRLGNNRGLEVLQYKLGLLGRDLAKINSIWDGSSILRTRIAIAILVISFVIHLYVNNRLLWIVGTFLWYFGSSPYSIRFCRAWFGFGPGIAKVLRRRHLHEQEVAQHIKAK